MDLDQWSTSRLILTAARLVENAWNRELEDSGITYAGLTVLIALALHNHSNAELARDIQVRPQTMGRTLERLEHRGFIARVPSTVNHKEQLFALTPAGENILARTTSTELRILPKELTVTRRLRKVLQNLINHLNRLG